MSDVRELVDLWKSYSGQIDESNKTAAEKYASDLVLYHNAQPIVDGWRNDPRIGEGGSIVDYPSTPKTTTPSFVGFMDWLVERENQGE
jgi:hypothetical protein